MPAVRDMRPGAVADDNVSSSNTSEDTAEPSPELGTKRQRTLAPRKSGYHTPPTQLCSPVLQPQAGLAAVDDESAHGMDTNTVCWDPPLESEKLEAYWAGYGAFASQCGGGIELLAACSAVWGGSAGMAPACGRG